MIPSRIATIKLSSLVRVYVLTMPFRSGATGCLLVGQVAEGHKAVSSLCPFVPVVGLIVFLGRFALQLIFVLHLGLLLNSVILCEVVDLFILLILALFFLPQKKTPKAVVSSLVWNSRFCVWPSLIGGVIWYEHLV